MRVLFLHTNFPAQYRNIATALAQEQGNQVMFGTMRAEGELPRVGKGVFKTHREPHPETHPYIRPLETAVLQGQGVYRLAQALKQRGFVPDVVCGHSGWGVSLYVKDAFPAARLLSYFEWYYNATGSDSDFLRDEPQLSDDDRLRIRTKNAPILLDLAQCDQGLCPTDWQRQQFPAIHQNRPSGATAQCERDRVPPRSLRAQQPGGVELAHFAHTV